MSRLADLTLRMPKVELHVHLEGAIAPRTLLDLARRHRVTLPADSEEGLREWFRFQDFDHFVQIYLACSRCLRTPEDFQRVVDDFLREQARQNILWSEVHFTISTHLANGANGREVGEAMGEAIAAGERRWGVGMKLIPDIVRNVGYKAADRTLEWALEHRDLVAALGLSGFESYSNEPFREHFEFARREGLARVAHAGEHGGPESIRAVLSECAAQRVGHGVRAVQDPSLVEELRLTGVPLEVCPTSNVLLGVAPDLASHPLSELLDSGVELSINSDDPSLFGVSLSDEYRAVGDVFDLDPEAIGRLSMAALSHSLMPSAQRESLESVFTRQLSDLGLELYDTEMHVPPHPVPAPIGAHKEVVVHG